MGNTEIAILLSTYNSERFINEQLESIKKQERVKIVLIIRDDGSTDSTLNILHDFREKNKEKLNIDIIEGQNVGYVESFYLLTQYALKNYPHIEYFAFADHDDYWLPDKVYKALEQVPKLIDKPALYCSNTTLVDSNLNYLGLYRKNIPKISFESCLIQNIVTGCTTLFNRKAAELFVNHRIPKIKVHDQYLYIICTLLGKTFYDPTSHILYRQHGNNQVGKPNFKLRFKTYFSKLFSKSHSLEQRAKYIHDEFKDILNPEALYAVKTLAFYRSSLKSRFILLTDSRFSYPSIFSNIIFSIKILLGRV